MPENIDNPSHEAEMLAEHFENHTLSSGFLENWFRSRNSSYQPSPELGYSQDATIKYFKHAERWGRGASQLQRFPGRVAEVVDDPRKFEPHELIKRLALMMRFSTEDNVISQILSNQNLGLEDWERVDQRLTELLVENPVSYDAVIFPETGDLNSGYVILYNGNNRDQNVTSEPSSAVELPLEVLIYSNKPLPPKRRSN